MADGDEPSALEYARFHGLAIDHRRANSLSGFIDSALFIQPGDEVDLYEIEVSVEIPAKERFQLSKDAAAFLSWIKDDQDGPADYGDAFVPEPRRYKHPKMEIQLLRTDHTCDMEDFGTRINPDLRNHHLPPAVLDEDADEGISWPSSYSEPRLQAELRSESEKLTVSKETFLYLNDVTKRPACEEETLTFDISFEKGKNNRVKDPLTPPLLPMSPVITSYVPSSETGALELLSEQESPTRKELSSLEKKILMNDTISFQVQPKSSDCSTTLVSSDNLAEIYSPLKDISEQPELSVFKRTVAEDLKIEVPLTPPKSEQPPPWRRKHVSFQAALVEVIPSPPSPIPSPGGTSLDDIDQFFMEVVRPIAEEADRRIEQEQLQEADTIHRVQVPVMDFTRVPPPWKIRATEQKGILENIKSKHFNNSFWPLQGKISRSLPWAPFPTSLAKVAVSEKLEVSSDLEALIAQPECLDHNMLIWKSEGIRMFDQADSDDDEISYGHFPKLTDIQNLLRKRKHELKIGEIPLSTPSVKEVSTELEQTKNPFSAGNAINDFIDVRTGQGKKQKLTKTSYFPVTKVSHPEPEIAKSDSDQLSPASLSPAVAGELVALPELQAPLISSDFIVSSSFLANRPLFRLIETLNPMAKFIERDFKLHNTPHLSTKNITLADEADIILSPSACLITTTLQKLAQRSLPGSSILSPIFNRLLRIAPRYTAFYILVTDDVASTISAASFAPLIALHAFLASLTISYTPTVSLIPAPAAGMDPLLPIATYIVHLMSTHATDFELQQEETNWEIFLRRAGLNAFAAQVVLEKLKPPVFSRNWDRLDAMSIDGDGEADEKKWGLSSFVRMSQEEKIKRFEGIIDRELVERVGSVMEGRW